MVFKVFRKAAALFLHIILDGVGSALADLRSVRQVHTAHARLRCKGDELHALNFFHRRSVQLFSKFDDRFAFGGIILHGTHHRVSDKFTGVHAAHGNELRGHPVAICDGSGLVQNHGVHVAADFNSLAGKGDDIESRHAIHAGNADGGEKTADGGRNQTYREGNQRGDRQMHAAVYGHGIQGDNDDQEDDGKADQQRVQRDFVRCFLAGSAFDEGDHLVQKGFAGVGGDADFKPVAGHGSTAG